MTPGVVKTAAKAFPDVAAQCQEKESADLRTTQTPRRVIFLVKFTGETFVKLKKMATILQNKVAFLGSFKMFQGCGTVY